ncbi:MAG: PD-(D/E)XK nuclease family protein, partial [Bifidobacteriaceae bacterium]|nr:PD-(D/E)XK nuclease family protein [Bifidobacteriaceae bacterium]
VRKDSNTVVGDTAAFLQRGLTEEFITQIRNIFIILDNCGIEEKDDTFSTILHKATPNQRVQWQLAIMLHSEYLLYIKENYQSKEYRIDTSHLFIQAIHCIESDNSIEIPQVYIVDDAQNVTIGQFRFIETLAKYGTRIILVMNPDECVESFRGANPEYIFSQACEGVLQAQCCVVCNQTEKTSYKNVIEQRIANSITSNEENLPAVLQRPWKPKTSSDVNALAQTDTSLSVNWCQNIFEEAKFIVQEMISTYASKQASWNDMAVIAHDNSILDSIALELERAGVPTRYSQSMAYKDNPLIQGLLALIELALIKQRGINAIDCDIQSFAARLRALCGSVISSGIINPRVHGDLRNIENSMNMLISISQLLSESEQAQDETSEAYSASVLLREVSQSWQNIQQQWSRQREEMQAAAYDSQVKVDNSLLESRDDFLTVPALYMLLWFADSEKTLLNFIVSTCKVSSHGELFEAMFALVEKISTIIEKQHENIYQTISEVWKQCNIQNYWQNQAISRTSQTVYANQILDNANGFFQYLANNYEDFNSLQEFITHIQSMFIQPDSLAQIAPQVDAVDLYTSASIREKKHYVWLMRMQNSTWPNMHLRNTMFSGEELLNMVLHELQDTQASVDNSNAVLEQFRALLQNEQKSLLVSLSCAQKRLQITAVVNSDDSASEFLYTYMPELCNRNEENQVEKFVKLQSQEQSINVRSLLAKARSILSVDDPQYSDEMRSDAVNALEILKAHHILGADERQWPFAYPDDYVDDEAKYNANLEYVSVASLLPEAAEYDDTEKTVVLSPSNVDSIWGCPICYLIDSKFKGPSSSNLSAQFGTMIHNVARIACEEKKLDFAENQIGETLEDKQAYVAEQIMQIIQDHSYERGKAASLQDVFKNIKFDNICTDIANNIAQYFVYSYKSDNAKIYPLVSELKQSYVEKEFNATFGISDITQLLRNSSPQFEDITEEETYYILGFLIGGWPEGLNINTKVKLTGRIDRLEERQNENGELEYRIIDYKTTSKKHKAIDIYSDLQLVCYQLGLYFDENNKQTHPNIIFSALFDVIFQSSPAKYSKGNENAYQPPLIVNNAITTNTYGQPPRLYLKNYDNMWVNTPVPVITPYKVRKKIWDEFRTLSQTDGLETCWALSMIARVFYAAGIVNSNRIIMRCTSDHQVNCFHKDICPVCPQTVDTVYEVREV